MVLALANYHAEEKKPERITKNARERKIEKERET